MIPSFGLYTFHLRLAACWFLLFPIWSHGSSFPDSAGVRMQSVSRSWFCFLRCTSSSLLRRRHYHPLQHNRSVWFTDNSNKNDSSWRRPLYVGCSVSAEDAAGDETWGNTISLRRDLLHKSLLTLGMDFNTLEQAVDQSLIDPTTTSSSSGGYDHRYGRSALRTVATFLYPKPGGPSAAYDRVQLQAAATRTARQVQFLVKRHEAHHTEWVRQHDDVNTITNSINCTESSQRSSGASLFPLILLLDNVRSAANVGSLFRTADAAGCAGVITVGITPHPGGNGAHKLQKSALGAECTVPSVHFGTMAAALEALRKNDTRDNATTCSSASVSIVPSFMHRHLSIVANDYQLVGMETTKQSIAYTDFEYDSNKGVVLVLGNEVTGVEASVLQQLDAIVEIPMYGTKNSLNVAACAPIVLYEILRQWNVANKIERN